MKSFSSSTGDLGLKRLPGNESFKPLDLATLPQNKKILPTINRTSKLLSKYKGKKTEAQIAHEAAVARMTEGLRLTLKLHKPVELSSICGVLGLKTLERAHDSMEFIMEYAKDGDEVAETKVTKIVEAMWEGALFEYLINIGSPLQSSAADPKVHVLRLWKEGMICESNKFIPHYITRIIPERYQDIPSPDIVKRAAKLKSLEDRVKLTEYRMHENHDYRNVLLYLQHMTELRKSETDVRDYLINELEIARAKLEHTEASAAIVSESLMDLEDRYVKTCEFLNNSLATEESTCEYYLRLKIHLEAEIQRVTNIQKSYHSHTLQTCKYPPPSSMHPSFKDQSSSIIIQENIQNNNNNNDNEEENIESNNSNLNPESNDQDSKPFILEIKDLHESSPCIQILYNEMNGYKSFRDQIDSILYERDSKQINEILKLEYIVKNLQDQITSEKTITTNLSLQLQHAYKEIQHSAELITRYQVLKHDTATVTWATALEWASKLEIYAAGFRKLQPFIYEGLIHSNSNISKISQMFSLYFDIFTQDQIISIIENSLMKNEDNLSHLLRTAHLEELLNNKTKKKKKVVTTKSGKLKTKSSGKATSSGSTNKKGQLNREKSASSVRTAGGGNSNASISGKSNKSTKSNTTKKSSKTTSSSSTTSTSVVKKPVVKKLETIPSKAAPKKRK
eukprot:gene6836-13845_t